MLDTNIIVSAIVFGGKARDILRLVLRKQIVAYISPVLIAELFEVLSKKFLFTKEMLHVTEKQIKRNFVIYQPTRRIVILKDEPDNRLLELAIECGCPVIITGDKDLLKLGKYKKVSIYSIRQWLTPPTSL